MEAKPSAPGYPQAPPAYAEAAGGVPPAPGVYPQPMPGQPGQGPIYVVQQPQEIIVIQATGKIAPSFDSYNEHCPHCNTMVMTRVERSMGFCSWTMLFLGLFVFFPLLCCFCLDGFKDSRHAISLLRKACLRLWLITSYLRVRDEVFDKLSLASPPDFLRSNQLQTEFKPFGLFPEIFTTCGKFTSPKINPGMPDTVASSLEISVDCEPTPGRVIVSDAQNFGDFKRDLKKECELLTCSSSVYPNKGDPITGFSNQVTGIDAKAAEPENPARSVCEDKLMQYPNNQDFTILYANEGNCFEFAPNLKDIVSPSSGKTIKTRQVPRWLKKDQDRVDIRNFYFSDEKSENLFRVPYAFTFKDPPQQKIAYKECGTACDQGTVLKYGMKQGTYSMMIYVNAQKCSSFRICFNPEDYSDDDKIPKCKDDFIIDVLFRNGVIVWGKKGRSSVIEFISAYHDEATTVPIEFGFGVKVGGKTSGNFYFGNDHREMVTSDSGGYGTDIATQLAFFFPDDSCLTKTAGIFSKTITYGKSLTDGDVVKDYVKFDEQGQQIDLSTNEQATTTVQPKINNFVFTTTPMSPRIIPEPGALSLIESDEGNNEALYITGKWWIWGIYFGFIAGTLLTLGIGGGLFYVLRRTVFSVWYRGMYKRYGCDVSGTTGGITGVGFGGNTTAAVETVATGATGASTVGTIAGTTVGSTSGSTSGASTIGM
ncbi:hypothetical protein L3Y34_000269 [Caenorhabditis briggsae]|uniref:LITAF domain-containing protein n=1 Tax=Caenorhabditis briggsae TaxID=6238 RepID=A0AAE9D8Y5_CAEBR|nr:hypothetical protein L3Y34_000269 [Caenorhabditis briggsae]